MTSEQIIKRMLDRMDRADEIIRNKINADRERADRIERAISKAGE